MRLTPEFVSNKSSNLNAIKERELDLRGLAIPMIENLASHQGTYDTLNLADNSITVLGNIPLAPRLRQLHAPLNQISSISTALPSNLPNLVTLTLSDNAIASLSTLLPLESLIHLRHLVLRGNPVAEHEHYKDFVIWKVAKGALHTLDYTRIKDSHRASARALLLEPETSLPNALALQLSTSTAPSISAGAATSAAAARAQALKAGKGRLMTPDEKRRVVEALTAAQTADEVRRLERMLAEGVIPEDAAAAAEVVEVVGDAAEAGAEAEKTKPVEAEAEEEEAMDVEPETDGPAAEAPAQANGESESNGA